MASDGQIDKIEINLEGVQQVLKSKAVADELERRAEKIKKEADRLVSERQHGYEDGEFFGVGGPRKEGRKTFVTVYGMKDIANAMQAKHDVLTNAIDAGRGL